MLNTIILITDNNKTIPTGERIVSSDKKGIEIDEAVKHVHLTIHIQVKPTVLSGYYKKLKQFLIT